MDSHIKAWKIWKDKQRRRNYYLKNKDRIYKYFAKNSTHYKNYRKQYVIKHRILALSMIQKDVKCVRCGCTDVRFLEINHKNGGGYREKYNTRLAWSVVKGKRKTEDLEILCRPCNHIHYLEQKYGGQIPLKVVWNPEPLPITLISQ